jgi:acetylserotonin N-methyltransferase
MSLPDPEPIIDLLDGFRRSKAMFAAVSMGIFDMLEDAPLTAVEVNARLGTNLSATERLLEACVGMGLLERNNGAFANRPVASVYLRESSDRALNGYINYSNLMLYPCWGNLEDAVREGTARWTQTFGSEKPIYENFFSTPEKMRAFTMGMHGLGLTTSPSVASAFDLSGYRTFADLGAATGHLVITACEKWPKLKGIVFDLQKVLPIAQEFISASSARARLSIAAGDFFTDELPAADLFALGRILHNYDDDRCRLLLRRIFDRLPSGGALLLAEKLLAEDRSGPLNAHLQSLSMLVLTEGKERSLSEYRALLNDVGFQSVEGRKTGRYLDAVLATKR